MKSDARKSSARSKSSAPVNVAPAVAEELIDTEVNIEVADADYAAELLTAAEALDSKAVKTNKPAAAKSKTESVADAVVLPAQCLMRDAIDLKKQLLPKLDAAAVVKIDIKKLERIDAAALQVLLAFVRDRSQQQRAVEWLGMNEVMIEAAKTLGLESLLRVPVMGAAA